MRYNHLDVENEVLDFWKKNEIHKKANAKNQNNKKFYFLDGPPFTSGHVHIGTAWNKVLKDCILRYRRMKGEEVWDRAGYDMHGLPVENKVMNNLGFKTKEEIVEFGKDKFVKQCKDFAVGHLNEMNKEFKRLGVWMDFEHPYRTIDPEYISGEWNLIKTAWDKGRVYQGEKTMTWCKSCATALAKHELEYQNVVDKSIYVKFKVKDNNNDYLIIWTTTPWTIPFNLGIMVNPEVDYVKCKVTVDGKPEHWILAKNMVGILMSAVFEVKDYEIIEEFKGKTLKGVHYVHPFYDELKADYDSLSNDYKNVHSVVLSKDYVDLSAGTGLVHMAPGCGPEDYLVGRENNIPPYNLLNEYGQFPASMGVFANLEAKKDDKEFIDYLNKKKVLLATVDVEHDYAFCWRCHQPVVFRTTNQWFFKIEDLIEQMRKNNQDIHWVPEWSGSRTFDSWLENIRDNSITRQRFWGSPVPIWKCDCGHTEVIGSLTELKEKAINEVPNDIHIPWIDEVKLKCPKCGKEMTRISDILDVWIDSGSASWTSLGYPDNKEKFNEMFPADYIIEGKDQIRGWFNLLMVSSTLNFGKAPFKNVGMHGFIIDPTGEKMSKSKGNIIKPAEIIEKYGVDAFRLYSIQAANPGEEMVLSRDEIENKRRNLNVLWNVYTYLEQLCDLNNINPTKLSFEDIQYNFGISEKYIFSKLNKTIEKVTKLYESYEQTKVPALIEELFLSLSRDYIKTIRNKANSEDLIDKKAVIYTIYNVLFETLKMLSTISPFISEKIYQNLKEKFELKQESLSLFDWPKANKKWINKEIEKEFDFAQEMISDILSLRDEIKRNVRWPIKAVVYDFKKQASLSKDAIELIEVQTNVKKVSTNSKLSKEVKLFENNDYKLTLDLELTKDLIQDGIFREFSRRIQIFRKQLKLTKDQKIVLGVVTSKYGVDAINRFEKELFAKVGLEKLVFEKIADAKLEETFEIEKNSFSVFISV